VSFLSVGIDHTHASLDLLERVALGEEQTQKLLAVLSASANVHEAVVVATCLRTEVVAVIDRFHGAVDDITNALAAVTGVEATELAPVVTMQFDRGVVAHLFEVAAGLLSTVPGEHEILGQLRRSLALAEEQHAAGPELAELFQRAISAGRRVRTETAIARGSVSFAHAALDLASEALGGAWPEQHVVVVGAGQLALGVVRGLTERSPGPASITVANRTVAHADTLAREVGDDRVQTRGLTDLAAVVDVADVLVIAAEAIDTVLPTEPFLSRSRPLVILDLAMPRAIDPAIDDHAPIIRRDVHHLGALVEQALEGRREEVQRARDVVTLEVERYQEQRRSRGAAGIVGEFRDHLERLRDSEVARRRGEFADLTDEQFERVVSLTRSLVAKVAHQPTVTLKDAAGTDRGLRLNEALRQLFDLA
jgi:glutamyl-tRNA reductase